MELPECIKTKLSLKINDNIIIDSRWGISNTHELQQIIDSYINNIKTVYIFFITDCCDAFLIPNNVKVYRTSLLKSIKKNSEFLLPYIWEGFNAFEPLENPDKPIIGFCGLIGPYRYKTIEMFYADNRIITKFILRNHFWGGAPHNPSIIKDFLNNLKESHFNICNRGAGNFSMRFYQTLSCGRIPILLNTDILLPFEEEIPWDDIIIFADTEQDLIEKTINCVNIVERQIKCRDIYEKYFEGTKFLDGIFSM